MKESKFTGGLLGLIGTYIVSFLITTFTLGIGAPWAVCYKEAWLADHTYIEGKRLEFHGKGIQLFGKYIVWFLLTIITLGIYSFWLGIKLKQWVVSKTTFAGN
ncbi:MAG: DUF898 family protein [Bacilli bacterium]|nr:DUF898 family protein [Bacilli bacterium]